MPTTLRRVLITTVCFAFSFTSALARAPQVKDDLFSGAEKFAANAKQSSEVNLDKNMLRMAGKFSDSGDLMSKMDFVIIHSYEYSKAGDYTMSDVEEFSKRLDAAGFSHIVRERSATSSTDVSVKTDVEGQVSELVIIDAEPKELNFIHLKGHLNLNDMMKAGAKYGAPSPPAPPVLQKR